MLVRRNEIRVRSHYGLARAKGSRELRRCVLSDIVKRRSFRVAIVVVCVVGLLMKAYKKATAVAHSRHVCVVPARGQRERALSVFCLTAGDCRFDLASWSF